MGLVLAGAFPTDPALGYPPGVAQGFSVGGGIHQLGGTLLFAGLIGACFVWASRFACHGQRRWAIYSVVTGVLVTVCAFAAGVVYRLMQKEIVATGPAGLLELLSFAIGFFWVTLVALRLTRTVIR